ncbi:ABC transporter substrate-binding protein [Roseomonas sp. BN140053]|uniref:ABC transporter substrate-binding protein n=1 Tax=Roseomonas sp. BN140053 TaxID=3391898 RepID=UPI0039EA9063
MISRRNCLAAAGALATLPRFAIAQSVPELQTMRSTSKAWLWLGEDYAQAGGFFERAQVKVVSNASNRGTNIAALAGNSGVDIVTGDPGELMNAVSQDFGAKSFLHSVNRYASHVVVRKEVLDRAGVSESSPLPAKLAAMKGLRLGTTGPGAAPDNLLRWLAVKGGLNPNSDTQLVPMQGGGPGMIAGLQQKVIDGFCLSSPTSDIAVMRADCAYLFNNATNPPPDLAPFCYIIASASTRGLRDKREALIRYATGVSMALRSIRDEPEKFRAFATNFLELDPAIATQAVEANSRIFATDPVFTPELYRRNTEFLSVARVSQGEPPVPASLTLDRIFDGSILAEAAKRLP